MNDEGSAAQTAEDVRRSLIAAATGAYEDAGLSGLCAEGRWEAAVSAMQALELRQTRPPWQAGPVDPREATLAEFALAVAAPVAAPGGGSVAAVAGVLAAALAQMVATLTARDRRRSGVDADMRNAAFRAARLGDELSTLAARDAVATAGVVAAFRSPASAGRAADVRAASVERALVHATEVPLEIARAAADVAELGAFVAEHGKTVAVSEAGVAALLADAACRGVGFAVSANVASLRRVRETGPWSRFADEAAVLAARSTLAAQRATAAVQAASSR